MQINLNRQMNAVILFIIGIPLIEIYLMIKVGGVVGATDRASGDLWPADEALTDAGITSRVALCGMS